MSQVILFFFASAFAEDAAVSTRKTYVLVAGSSEYAWAQGQSEPVTVPGVEGATTDCQVISTKLIAFGFPTEQVLTFCGDALIKADLFTGIKSLKERMTPGDTLTVVWEGHGGIDQKNAEIVKNAGAKRIAAVRGIFAACDSYQAARQLKQIMEN